MNARYRSRHYLFALVTTLTFLFAWQTQAQAFGGILDDFNALYGTANTRLGQTDQGDRQCSTCHTSNSNFGVNPYGSDLSVADDNFIAIEGMDSDGDGFSNITEIQALTFPGNANDFPEPVNQSPTADPNGPYNGTVGSPVQFSGSASSDPDGNIVAYDWNFGDGSAGTGVNPTHTYNADGAFTVTLTVTDNAGATGTASTTATIALGNQAPTANPNGPYFGTVGSQVMFDGSSSSDPDGTIVSYSWNFGDGASGTGVNPTHTYSAAGTYNVTLTVMDNAGASDSASTSATITDVPNLPPVANANGPYSGTVGVPVTFDGTGSSDPDGSIVRYDWNFGDGTTALDGGPTPSHTYQSNGGFTVTLTVTDDAGATASDSTSANIGAAANQAPTADANGPYNGTVGSSVQFDGSGSSDPDGFITSYLWDFGDGSTGTGVNPSHTYNSAGTFTVTLTVSDNDELTDSDTTTATIGVGNLPPSADANGPYSGTVGVAVQFDGSGSSDPEGGALSYAWDFGDGNSGFGVSPTHTYSAAGTYNVTLTVTDNAGATDSDMTTATIAEAAQPDGNVNLEIEEFDVESRYYLNQREAVEIELEVRNRGTADEPRMATVIGTQNGMEVYRQTMMVSAPVGGFRDSEFEFPSFRPSQLGTIAWVAMIESVMVQETETTSVLSARTDRRDNDRRRDRDDDNDDDDDDDDD